MQLTCLTFAQQRAVIDLVCSGELSQHGVMWHGKERHRTPTIEALRRRGLVRQILSGALFPTQDAITLVGAERK